MGDPFASFGDAPAPPPLFSSHPVSVPRVVSMGSTAPPEFSPVVSTRKAPPTTTTTSALGGGLFAAAFGKSHSDLKKNDDFNFFDAVDAHAAAAAETPTSTNPFDDDELWEDVWKENESDDDDNELYEDYKQGPPTPRALVVTADDELLKTIFASLEALRTFSVSPYVSDTLLHLRLTYDKPNKVFRLCHADSGRVLLTSFKRIDGYKMLSPTINCPMLVNFSDPSEGGAAAANEAFLNASHGMPSRLLIGKLRSNAKGSLFQLYDDGLAPKKAKGAMDSRRELGSIKFEKVQSVFSRRKVSLAVPKRQQFRRPRSKQETLFRRSEKGDSSVHVMPNHMPARPERLPYLKDFEGLAAKNSIKNTMLHDPEHPGKRAVLVVGKIDRATYNVFLRDPVSPAVAFACAIASILSYVHPQHQIA